MLSGEILFVEIYAALLIIWPSKPKFALSSDGAGDTGDEAGGAEEFGLSVSFPGFFESSGEFVGDTVADGLGDTEKSPKMFVAAAIVGVLKSLYAKPSLSGYIIFFQICAAGFPETYIRSGVS